MKKYFLLICFSFLTFLAFAQEASDIPPRPNPPRLVNDLADMLRPEEEQALEQKLVNYNDTTSTQIAIVTITSLGPYEIASYAYRIGETWGIGGKGKNNGILILVSKNERKVNISTGYGLEHVVPDAYAKRIIEQIIKPAFRQNDFYGGLNSATDQLILLASGEYQAEPKNYQDGGDSPLLFWLIIGLLALFIISRIFRGGGGRRGGGMRTLMNPYGGFGTFGDFSGGRGPFGGGGFGGGGGGFGGFGGGSFGGGGASGDW
ncbi:TPM domain-containing protein [Adhaeribacter soli]|uniref:TPM domain-containing protein n=1 Tax=Adhaeribacter soli TaxID=2607655 RepID=A0A5N1J636_9BACT|nr:TPM domain-containing protein [Adhaeribacter soli]KAA9340162.1 TPM domain-containing protein [Adhaeribacter soli]